ncbi:MAG: phosphotransferase [Desulfotalea sp.]
MIKQKDKLVDMNSECKDVLVDMLKAGNLDTFLPLTKTERLAGDGSSRQFFRIEGISSSLIAVLPAEISFEELAESASVWKIGTHLQRLGVAVPQLVDWHEDSGLVLFEDLGDVRLHDIAHSTKGKDMYRLAIKDLVGMNCKCGDGLNEEWCGEWKKYNTDFMNEKESGYFLWAFWRDLLGNDIPKEVAVECKKMAEVVAKFDTDFFLHQDFQSRNIMIKNDIPRIIDFQGGKKGPIGYDIASLLNDPYVGLDDTFKTELLELYWQESKSFTNQSFDDFQYQYKYLSCQRSLQIIGAFSFLSQVKKKMFFQEFIMPSLKQLRVQLADICFENYPILRQIVSQAVEEYTVLND